MNYEFHSIIWEKAAKQVRDLFCVSPDKIGVLYSNGGGGGCCGS
jgi:hypothetical protein